MNGLSDSFLLTCGGIESVAWHPKIVAYTHTPAYTTESNLQYDHEWFKADYKPESPPPPFHSRYGSLPWLC